MIGINSQFSEMSIFKNNFRKIPGKSLSKFVKLNKILFSRNSAIFFQIKSFTGDYNI